MAASASASFSCRSSRFLGDSAFRSPSPNASRVGFASPRAAAAASAAYTATERPLRYASPKRAQSTSLYDVLGITAGATRQEIKAAYRRLARVCHPDVRKDAASEAEFMRIHAAYATLSDPEKRADYDRICRPRAPMRTPSSFSGYSRRTWETDQCCLMMKRPDYCKDKYSIPPTERSKGNLLLVEVRGLQATGQMPMRSVSKSMRKKHYGGNVHSD
ncbi:hypothetical protein H6P81_018463 [Aristolochia fimbriata]|uniref:J domain-containing protein n=1 Tax=Aristolochia fimbriata TaxID=158543 RepID=A0AAV7E1F9_ARIFI|nr:hypothetical protein H6P81_018463 [Aristolochia fimbriata]